jgi:hypothetical protein
MPNSYNGWPASENKAEINIQPFGDNVGLPFPGGVKGGDVATVLGYVATQFHYRVEPVVSGWDWGYTYKANVNNPSSLSCHASGTALDINSPEHPNGVGGTFTDAQVGEIYAILDEVQGAVDWLEGYDEMHFEIAVDADTLADVARALPATGAPQAPDEGDDDMPLTEADYDNIARRVWALSLTQGDGVTDAQAAWSWLVQARNAAMGAEKSFEARPAVMAGQSRDEAITQTRNNVSTLIENG